MHGTLFDSYVVVDWSAAQTCRGGANSIWIAYARPVGATVPGSRPGAQPMPAIAIANPRSRAEALAHLRRIFASEIAAQRRVLAGFDFPFGYPAGSAALMAGPVLAERGADWREVWAILAAGIEDAADNRNNRFAFAATLNAAFGPEPGPFWGHHASHSFPGLARTRPAGYGAALPPERRAVEARVRRAKPCWQLYGNGSVGGQALTGIAALEALRQDAELGAAIRLWPFQTGLAAPVPRPGSVVLAEVYPSLINPTLRARQAAGEVRDRAQVRVMAGAFAALDAAGGFAPLFDGPPERAPDALSPGERRAVEREEAWILGVGHEEALAAAAAALPG